MRSLPLILACAAVAPGQQEPQSRIQTDAVAISIQTGPKNFLVELAPQTGGGRTRTIWQGTEAASVCGRLDERHLLLHLEEPTDALMVLDLETSETRRLVGCQASEVVTVFDGQVIFHRPRDVPGHELFSIPWRGGKTRSLGKDQIIPRQALGVHPFVFAPALDHQRIYRFDLRDGSVKDFVKLPKDTNAVRMCASPSGRLLAISSCSDRNAQLQVVDIATGAAQKDWTGLSANPDMFIPALEIEFPTEDLVTAIEFEVVGDVPVEKPTTRSVRTGYLAAAPPPARDRFTLSRVADKHCVWRFCGPRQTEIAEIESPIVPTEVSLAPDRTAAVAQVRTDGPAQLLRLHAPATDLPKGSMWYCHWLTSPKR